MVATITRDELRQRMDAGARLVLVEIQPPAFYHQGHLPGAVNLPPSKVKELAATLLPDREAEIVVYCARST